MSRVLAPVFDRQSARLALRHRTWSARPGSPVLDGTVRDGTDLPSRLLRASLGRFRAAEARL